MPRLASAASLKERPAKYERRKVAILNAAVDVINRKGVRGMTMADVAGQLDLVPTAVSYYYRRKEELAGACFLQAIGFYNDLIARAAEEPDPRTALRRFMTEFADYLVAVDCGKAQPLAAFNDVRTIHDQTVDAAYTEMFRRFRRVFKIEERTDASRLLRNARTHLVISQVFWAALWLRRYDTADYPKMMTRMVDILLNGLAAETKAWRPIALPVIDNRSDSSGLPREAFLRAATEMINEHGYLGASVSRICARLNVTKGSFYHHNETKDDLVGHCFDRTIAVIRRTQMAAGLEAHTGFDSLAAATASLIERDVSGESPLLRTSALTAVPEEMQGNLIRRLDQTSAHFASVVSDGIADGSLRSVDANVAAQMITVTINASAELHHWAPGVTAANAAEVYARPLFMGLFSNPN